MDKIEEKKKRGRPKKVLKGKQKRTIDGRSLPRPYEIKDLPKKDQILAIKLRNPYITNVQISEMVGCHESLVRHYLKGEYAQQVAESIKEMHHEKILALQGKAFKRIEEMLDNPKTPPAVLANVCKFLLEQFLTVENNADNDLIEFETIISETGSVQQIRRKITEKRTISDNEKIICVDNEK